MIFDYWTVSYRPTPMSLTVYGLAIIVGDPSTGKFMHRQVTSSKSRIPVSQGKERAHDVVAALFAKLDRTKAVGNELLEFKMPLDPESIMNFASREWNNSMIVDGPRKVEHESIEGALAFLFDTHVQAGVKSSYVQKRTVVKRELTDQYSQREGIASRMVENPRILLPNELDREFDLAVVEAEIYEIDFAFSFAGEPNRSVRDMADSWALRVGELRKGKGQLSLGEDQKIKVDKDVPVVAMVYPAETERQQELYLKATAMWEDLDVDIVEMLDIPRHARELEQKIGA